MALAAVSALTALFAAGCGDADRAAREAAAAADTAQAGRLRALPHAAFIRFEETKGEGLARESWSVEILQADSDIWMTGSIRSKGRTVPVKKSMSVEEFYEVWDSLRSLDLEQLKLEEDLGRPLAGWTKSLVVDVVESSNRRIQWRHSWTRPLLGHAEIDEMEKRFQNLLVVSGERELGRQKAEAESTNAAQATARARADSIAAAEMTN